MRKKITSALSEEEKIFVRAKAVRLKNKKIFCFVHTDLAEALITAKSGSSRETEISPAKLKAAKMLQYNCLPKVNRPSFYVPCHFGAEMLLNEEGLSNRNLNILRRPYNNVHVKKSSNFNGELPNSSAITWKLRLTKSLFFSVVSEIQVCKKKPADFEWAIIFI